MSTKSTKAETVSWARRRPSQGFSNIGVSNLVPRDTDEFILLRHRLACSYLRKCGLGSIIVGLDGGAFG